jgi:aconitate decarboxylase
VLCTWLAHLSLNDVPDIVRERTKYLLLDGIGCVLVGAKLPWSALAVETVTRFEGQGDKTIIGWGRTTAGPAAALLNGPSFKVSSSTISIRLGRRIALR